MADTTTTTTTTMENLDNPGPITGGGDLKMENLLKTVSDDCKKRTDVGTESSEIMKPKTNDDVQRAIEGLKDIPDEELQEFLDDEDFMEGLDVVDAWEGEEEKRVEMKSRSRSKDRERKRTSRDRNRWRDHRSPNNRDKHRRDDRKKEETRRDPSKSTKDIERDKIRTQKDSESKILAEKKKAIKTLLDSDNVVPPGTEMEAIAETIAEKQNVEKLNMEKLATPRGRRSREKRKSNERNRRRSGERGRRSPHRRWSPIVMSPERRRSPVKSSPGSRRSPVRLSPQSRRSPFRISPAVGSPDRRRSLLRLSPNHPRRLSWERRTSAEERRRSAERHRRRQEANERDHRPSGRRSRSRERRRSRSGDRHRRRYSRSPMDRRGSPRWRSRSGSRGRSPQRRTRKRSPFINEIRRQFRNEGNQQHQQHQQQPPPPTNIGYMIPPSMGGMPPMTPQIYSHEVDRPPYMPPHHPIPQGMMMPGPPQGFMNFDPSHSHMPPSMSYDQNAPQPLMQSDFSSAPVMYTQQNPAPIPPPLLPLPVPSPQPVPAPGPIVDQGCIVYNQTHGVPLLPTPAGLQPMNTASRRSTTPHKRSGRSNTPHSYKGERRSNTPYNGTQQTHREERLRTPEPPVISNSKATFGKTSLSSLLEASVSAKDSVGPPVLYPGFRPEILRHCEHALRDLPIEDPRLKMKGRFFFNPKKEDSSSEIKERSSNSILLRKGKNKIYWDEEEERHSQITVKIGVNVHQKICQTDEIQTENSYVQATVTTADFGVQVYPYDLQPIPKEEKRPIMDRLDWNMRETFDYTPKPREADDLRWSLSNSSQKRPWGRGTSPTAREPDHRELSRERLSSSDFLARTLTVCTPAKNRDEYSSHRGSGSRDHFARDSLPPNYRQDVDERQELFRDNRSDHSRGESPMVLDDSPDEIEEETEVFPRVVTERLVFPKPPRGQSIPSYKGRGGSRGGRPYSGSRGGGGGGGGGGAGGGGGSFRGKF